MTNPPIEQIPLTKYSNKAVTDFLELGKMWAKLRSFEQNIEQIGQKKRIAGKKIGGKKDKIDPSLDEIILQTINPKLIRTSKCWHNV